TVRENILAIRGPEHINRISVIVRGAVPIIVNSHSDLINTHLARHCRSRKRLPRVRTNIGHVGRLREKLYSEPSLHVGRQLAETGATNDNRLPRPYRIAGCDPSHAFFVK